MREIHSFEDIQKAIEERAKAKFGDSVEIVERMHAAKKNRGHVRIIVQRFSEIPPLLSESVDRGLLSLLGLRSNLNGEVNQRRNPDNHCSQLTDRCQHF